MSKAVWTMTSQVGIIMVHIGYDAPGDGEGWELYADDVRTAEAHARQSLPNREARAVLDELAEQDLLE